MNEKFENYNPIVCFAFYLAAIVFGMIYVHPAFLLCGFVMAMAYMFIVLKRKALKRLLFIMPVFIIVVLINPVLNKYGSHVLFTYAGGRNYTLEALLYGLALGLLLVNVMMWFMTYNHVMSSDKFTYMFGNIIPSLSIVLCMILRLIPSFERRAKQIISARNSIGKAGEFGTNREKLENGGTIVLSLMTWAFENGIITADSMRSRGYGSGKRTRFQKYKWKANDIALFAIIAGLSAVVIWASANGGMQAEFTPVMKINGLENKYTLVGFVAYAILLAIPTLVEITGEIRWHILKSRI